MKPVIAESVYNRIQRQAHPLTNHLSEKLSKAIIVKDDAVNKNIITLNSVVDYIHESARRPIRIQIVLPEYEDIGRRKISILAPISQSLLGFREYDTVLAKTPHSEKKIRILKVQN